MKNFVSYSRVSSKKQGLEGLSIESQTDTVRKYVMTQGGVMLAEFTECESGKKTDKERPELRAALDLCKKTNSVLLVAKLDRLSRNFQFLINLMSSGVEFVCCDCQNLNKFSISIIALVAEHERTLISERTKAALKVAKARGTRLGSPDTVRSVSLMNEGARKAKAEFATVILPLVQEIRDAGVSTLQGIADCLNRRGIATRTGKQWFPATVRNILMA